MRHTTILAIYQDHGKNYFRIHEATPLSQTRPDEFRLCEIEHDLIAARNSSVPFLIDSVTMQHFGE